MSKEKENDPPEIEESLRRMLFDWKVFGQPVIAWLLILTIVGMVIAVIIAGFRRG